MVSVRDVVGNVVSEDGATYPVRYTYDSQNRRTSLSTTRDGVTWDTTTWTYDSATGNCLSKTYADNSTVTYTYTPDNLPLRTTYASGRWKENVYDGRRQIVGTLSSGGENDAVLQRDAYGRIVSESNNAASAIYALANVGTATNETVNAGTNAITITRTLDVHDRLNGLAIPSIGYLLGYAYADDGLIATISNADAVVTYAYTPDRRDAGYAIAFSGGGTFVRSVTRDPYRRESITSITNVFCGILHGLVYGYDALARPVTRNGDAFAYNTRGEVASAMIDGNVETHGYDFIGNSLLSAFNGATNTYTANNLNRYVSILRDSASPREILHDTDGNMTNDGVFTYAYDSASRLTTVSSNGIILVTNLYDCRGRRVRKTTPGAETTFLYDDWNLIYEREVSGNATNETFYYWGKDLSGKLQGAGGVGGLLYLKRNGTIYVPHYDVYGNILRYTDAAGNVVAEYTYNAFGGAISSSGPFADVFRIRYSTKYLDAETDLYYYGYRFYSPVLRRWLTRDPIEERGGLNLYGFCVNNTISQYDADGRAVRIEQNGRVITVTVNITIYYAHRLELNARTDLARIARRIKKQIEDRWNAQTWQYGCCTVQFKANVKYRNQVGKNGILDDNLIAISTDPKLRSEVYGVGGNTGYWNADNRSGSDWRYAHEAGHLMGLDDDYTDAGGPNPGHAGHMMGEDQGVVVQHEVDDIMRANNIRCN